MGSLLYARDAPTGQRLEAQWIVVLLRERKAWGSIQLHCGIFELQLTH